MAGPFLSDLEPAAITSAITSGNGSSTRQNDRMIDQVELSEMLAEFSIDGANYAVPKSVPKEILDADTGDLVNLMWEAGWGPAPASWALDVMHHISASEEEISKYLVSQGKDPDNPPKTKHRMTASDLLEGLEKLGVNETDQEMKDEEQENRMGPPPCPLAFQSDPGKGGVCEDLHEMGWDVAMISSFLEEELRFRVSDQEIKQYLESRDIEPYVFDYSKGTFG